MNFERCPHCRQRIRKPSRVIIRTQLLPVLSLLSIQREPLSTDECKKLFEDEPRLHAEIGSHFYQYRYFNLIRKEGGKWRATCLCDKFFDGAAVVPEFVYVLDGERIPTPEGMPEPPRVCIGDISPSLYRHPDLVQLPMFA